MKVGPRHGFTLVEIGFALVLSMLLLGVVWRVFSGGLRQSSFNLGRTEALMGALLVLATVEEDLRHMVCPVRESRLDCSSPLWRPGVDPAPLESTVPGEGLRFHRSLASKKSEKTGVFESERVTYKRSFLVPQSKGHFVLLRNGTPIRGARLSWIEFRPQILPRVGKGASPAPRYFIQTFVTAVDSTGKHAITLTGLTRIPVLSGDLRYPHWNMNPDPEDGPYLRFRGSGPP